jgi:PAS domain S-box-containing protein
MTLQIFHGSIRKRLALLFVASALPATLLFLYAGLERYNENVSRSENELLTFVSQLADAQEKTSLRTHLLLENLAKVPAVHNMDALSCTGVFTAVLKANPYLSGLTLATPEGDVVATTRPQTSTSLAEGKHFKNALATKQFAAGEYLVGRLYPVPIFPFAYPMLDDSGRVRGLLLASIELEKYGEQFKQMHFPQGSFFGVCDHKGTRLYRYPKSQSGSIGQPISRQMFEVATTEGEGLKTDKGIDGIERVNAFKPLRLNADSAPYMYMFVGTPKSIIHANAQRGVLRDLGLFAVAVAFTLTAGWFLGGKSLGLGLEKLAAASKRIGEGDLSVRVTLNPDVAEVATLSQAFNNMADSLSRDVAEKALAETALKESGLRFKALHNASFGGITIHDKGVILDCNQGLSTLTGYSQEELIGMDGLLLIAEQSRAMVRANIAAGHEKAYEAFGLRKNGEEYPLRLEARNIPYKGKAVRVVEFRDITETKQIEDALRYEAQRRKILLENSSDGIVTINHEHRVVEANERFASMLGYSREEVLGLYTWDYEAVKTREQIQKDFSYFPSVNMVFESRHRRKDGTVFDVEVSTSGALVGEQALVFAICRDITERKRDEAELLHAKELAEAANLAKSQFLANMSHEIRTPLNGVLGMLQLIRGSEVSGEVECYAEMAMRAGNRLTSLLGDILDLSRIEAGRMPLVINRFALSDVISALTETFFPLHYSKPVSLAVHTAQNIPDSLLGDEVRLRQILFNLVGNAMKFTDGGKVRLEVSPLLPHPSGRARLLFIISDTGLGIPDDKIAQICAPFVQVSEDYNRSSQGAGLGLSIVLKLVQAMNGTLTFESTKGLGTCVYLTLAFDVPEYETSIAAPRQGLEQEPPASLRLLLVEDEEISRMSARLILEKMKHHVVTASNGAEALQALRESEYDCVLMDVQMDVMDGLETTRQIRSGSSGVLDTQVPIIAMTAYAMTGDREKFLEAGMDGYVAKPVQVMELQAELGRVVAGRGEGKG